MITTRPSNQRGRFDFGWLDTSHSFSFGEYHDPDHMGFGPLRVINEDRVAPGQGFGLHPHRDMEILSFVVSGALEHRDSLGSHGVIRPGEVQRITAGSGLRHSEYNHSKTDPVHFLQVWIKPRQHNLAPSYDQRSFTTADLRDQLRLLVSPDGRNGTIVIQQDAEVRRGVLTPGLTLEHDLKPGRRAWVQVIAGSLTVNNIALSAGDGAAIEDEQRITLVATTEADLLLFDLP
jgi:redox-sensitive bicupin YhaK (pirin superfamily)